MQTNLMQCVVYGLSTDRLTPHPFNLCSNAGSTHTSISQTQPLDMTLSTCMARSVLSGTFPVKPVYDLGLRAAAQFQGLSNLLIFTCMHLADAFIQSDLFRLYNICQYVCSLGIEPTAFCAANAMPYH